MLFQSEEPTSWAKAGPQGFAAGAHLILPSLLLSAASFQAKAASQNTPGFQSVAFDLGCFCMELPTLINKQWALQKYDVINMCLTQPCYLADISVWSFECEARHSWHTGRDLCDSWKFLELDDASPTCMRYGKSRKFIAREEEGELFTAEMMNWDASTSEQLALPGTCKSVAFSGRSKVTPQEEVTLTDRHRRRLRCSPGTPSPQGFSPFRM